MASRIGNVFGSLMEHKIEEQQATIQRRYDDLTGDDSPPLYEPEAARAFYWGKVSEFSCGCAAEVHDVSFLFPILPQLLVTPRLIVNLMPLPEEEFSRRYGVTPKQMIKLADEEFIVPNVYHFLRGGWRDYSKYRSLWPILRHPSTRINALWISCYLDKRHRFSNIRTEATTFFEAQLPRITLAESKKIVHATRRGATTSIADIAAICGHQLAYLQTLGRNTCLEIVDEIQEKWETKGSRADAIRLLEATQGLTVGALTAAFGGRYHSSQPLHDRVTEVYGKALPVRPSDRPRDILCQLNSSRDLIREAEFCADVANELDNLGLRSDKRDFAAGLTGVSLSHAFPLSESQFDDFLKTLKRPGVRRGDWGRWADDVAEYVRGKGQRPDLAACQEVWREIDSNLKPRRVFPGFLESISRDFFLYRNLQLEGPPSPQSFVLQLILDQLGRGATCLARKLTGRRRVLWRTSVPRVLCQRWWSIRYKDRRAE